MILYKVRYKESEKTLNKSQLKDFVIESGLCCDTVYMGWLGVDSFSIKKFNHLIYSLNKGTKVLYCDSNIFIERIN